MLHGCREITPQTTPFVGRLSRAWTLAFPTATGAWHIPSVTFYSLIRSLILHRLGLAPVQLGDALVMKAWEDTALCRGNCLDRTNQLQLCTTNACLAYELKSRQALGRKTRESIAMLTQAFC